MAEFIKATTGLTRLAVATNPHHKLTVLYAKTMRALAKMPANAAYRTHTEKIISERANIVAKNKSVSEIENKINCGQIEEVILQAENELLLARQMLGWKPWEPLATHAPAQQWDWPPAQIKSLAH